MSIPLPVAGRLSVQSGCKDKADKSAFPNMFERKNRSQPLKTVSCLNSKPLAMTQILKKVHAQAQFKEMQGLKTDSDMKMVFAETQERRLVFFEMKGILHNFTM